MTGKNIRDCAPLEHYHSTSCFTSFYDVIKDGTSVTFKYRVTGVKYRYETKGTMLSNNMTYVKAWNSGKLIRVLVNVAGSGIYDKELRADVTTIF
jgi:hypothetical protein